MFSAKVSRLLKYGLFGGAAASTAVSLHANQYQLDSIGIVRLARATVTVFKIGAIYKKLDGAKLDKTSSEYKELKSKCHQESAEKLLELCCTNKGVYIKVGQHVATLEYLIPKEYVQTMKILHSHAPKNAIEDVFRVIKEDLKCSPSDLFETFEEEPLGTASLAQVHKATLKDGSIVAVKVQHPYVQGNAKVDMKTMEVLVKLMSYAFPEFKFQWLVDETKRNIPQELDFELEGRNAEQVAKMFEHVKWLQVPKVFWKLSSSRVLTMEFVEGGQVNDLNYIQQHNINPFEISDKIGKLYSHMIFINGFVHSDPHPGNILVKKAANGECKIILLDHGLYATLQKNFQVEYAKLWLSILQRDRTAMKLHSKNLGIDDNLYPLFACMVTGRPWESILNGIDRKQPSKEEMDFIQKELASFLPQMSSVLDGVNRQMLLILKTNDLIRGIEHAIKTNKRMGAFRVMSACCIRSVYHEKLVKAKSGFGRFVLTVEQYWQLLKINVFYSFLTLGRFYSTVKDSFRFTASKSVIVA